MKNSSNELEKDYNSLKRDYNKVKELSEKYGLSILEIPIEFKRFKTVFEDAAIGMALRNFEGYPIKVNKTLKRILGYTDTEFKKMKYTDFTHPDDIELEKDNFKKLSEGKLDFYQVEKRYLRKDKKIVWGKVTISLIRDHKNEPECVLGMMEDISDRKKAEHALVDSVKMYKTLFESSADGIFLMKEKFTDCNQEACDLFECPKEDIVGHFPYEFSPEFQPDNKKSIDSALEKIQAALSGKPQHFYWMHKTAKGRLFDADVTLNALKLGDETMLQATVRDISERKQGEKIQNVLYQISEAVLTTPDMQTLYSKLHEVIGHLMPVKNFYIALYDEKNDLITFPYFVDEYDPPQKPKKPGKGLTELVLRTGENMLVDAEKDLELRESGDVELLGEPQAIWLGIALKVEGKTTGVMVVQDYHDPKAYGEKEKQILNFVSEQIALAIERKRGVEERRKITEELRELNATKDKFFSIIAHDLRNPFVTLLGFSEILTSDFNELSDDEKLFYINEIYTVAKNSNELLNNLLEWSRSQTGNIDYQPEEFDLSDLVKENFTLLNANANSKKISLKSDVKEKTMVFADEAMVNTVIRNLITNSIKFTKGNGEVFISAEKTDSDVKVTISDTGIGMNEETVNSLFNVESQHSTEGTAKEKGTGLGLLLCKDFIERNKGKIWAESKEGEGSKFIFTLPSSK